MYELTSLDRAVLAAIGNDGLPFSAIRKLIGPDLSVLNRLCDGGYDAAEDSSIAGLRGKTTPTPPPSGALSL